MRYIETRVEFAAEKGEGRKRKARFVELRVTECGE